MVKKKGKNLAGLRSTEISVNFCSWGFSFYCFRRVVIKLHFQHGWTPFAVFFWNITVAIVTRFDTIRSFRRLPAPWDKIDFALDSKKIHYQCCTVSEFHLPWPQTTEHSKGKGGNAKLDWNVYERPLHRAEGRIRCVFSNLYPWGKKETSDIQ